MKISARSAIAVAVGIVVTGAFAALAADTSEEVGVEVGKGISGLLATGGGYGLSAVLFVALFFREKKMDGLTERIIAMVTKQSEVLAEHNINVRRHNELLERSLNRRDD